MWFSWLTHFLHFKTKILCLGFIPNQCPNASISVFGEVQEWGEVHWLQQIHTQMGQFFSPVMQTQNFHMPSPKQGKVIWPICLIMESLIHVHLWKSIITRMSSESMLTKHPRTMWNFWFHVTVSWDSQCTVVDLSTRTAFLNIGAIPWLRESWIKKYITHHNNTTWRCRRRFGLFQLKWEVMYFQSNIL